MCYTYNFTHTQHDRDHRKHDTRADPDANSNSDCNITTCRHTDDRNVEHTVVHSHPHPYSHTIHA